MGKGKKGIRITTWCKEMAEKGGLVTQEVRPSCTGAYKDLALVGSAITCITLFGYGGEKGTTRTWRNCWP